MEMVTDKFTYSTTEPNSMKHEPHSETTVHCDNDTKDICPNYKSPQAQRSSFKYMYKSKRKSSQLFCHICGRKLRSRTRLQEHLQSHIEDSGFQCNSCSQYFPSKLHLSTHKNRIHREVFSFKCDYCRMDFKLRGQLTKHIVSHFGGNMYKCRSCSKSFRSKCSLKNHEKSHSGIKSHICEVCNQRFAYQESLKRHMLIHTGDTPYKCEICGESFHLLSRLDYHTRKIHTGERYTCHICFKQYMEKFDMLRHIKHAHNGVFKPISCTICGHTFSRPKEIQKHMSVHTSGKLDTCGECGLTFKRKSELKKHIRFEHKGRVPCICDFCGFKCDFLSQMTYHIMSHLGEQPYSCKICNVKYGNETNLKRHMKVHSEFTEDKPPFRCYECTRIFTRKADWIVHINFHSAGSLYVSCDMCDYKCKQVSVLKRHKLTHIAGKVVTCEICDEDVDKNELLKHIRIVHDGVTPKVCGICGWQSYTHSGLTTHLKSHKNKS